MPWIFNRGVVTLCLCILAVSVDPAHGRQRAVDLEAAADDAFNAGRYMQALRLLQQAYDTDPRPGILANQGLVLEKMGQHARAVGRFEQYLALNPPRSGREMAELKIAQLKPEVIFISDPPGASVRLDGDAQTMGRTPFKTSLVIGPHFAHIAREGYAVARPSFTVRRGQQETIEVTLIPGGSEDPLVGQSGSPDKPWWLVASGGTALGAAVIFGGLTASEISARDDAGSVREWQDHADTAHGYSIVAYTGLIVGAAAFSVAWWLWD
ncbi:MAG: PEGA domain-containing protein [Bradymonadia bacterium]